MSSNYDKNWKKKSLFLAKNMFERDKGSAIFQVFDRYFDYIDRSIEKNK